MSTGDLLSCKTENDVRERIIYPLLRRLEHSPETITTQLPLKYKYLFLGRKKGPKKDRILLGEADYVIDVDGRLRLVVEAKRPGPISNDDREQAFSYAMHPQVRAVMFAVISGSNFEVFHTFHKPEVGPVLKFRYDELESNFMSLYNLLSPTGLLQSHPDLLADHGKPLSLGLRSFVKIENGKIEYTKCPSSRNDLLGMIVHLDSGSITRHEDGGILALISPSFQHQKISQFSKSIKSEKIEFLSLDEYISRDPSSPNTFKHKCEYIIPAGTVIPRLEAQDEIRVSNDIIIDTEIDISGHLEINDFIGLFTVKSRNNNGDVLMQFEGNVKLRLK